MAGGAFPIYAPEDWIYRFAVVELVITGPSSASGPGAANMYPVASLTIMLAHNGIPTLKALIIEALAFPGGVPTGPASSSPPRQATLAVVRSVHSEIQQMINNEDYRVSLNVALECDAEQQFINFENWIVTGGGLEGIGSAGNFTVTLTAQHPAYLANSTINYLSNLGDLTDMPDEIPLKAAGANTMASNPLPLTDPEDPRAGFLLAMLAFMAEAQDPLNDVNPPAAGDNLMVLTETLRDNLQKSIDALIDHTEWHDGRSSTGPATPGAGKPFNHESDLISEFDQFFTQSFWAYTSAVDTPWGVLSRSITGAYEVCISGDATDNPLRVYPFAPWGKSIGMIYDDEIFDLQQPAVDGYPLTGVVARYKKAGAYEDFGMFIPVTEGGGATTPTASRVEDTTSVGAFLDPLKGGVIGKVDFAEPPEWIRDYLDYKAGRIPAADSPLDAQNQSDAFTAAAAVPSSLANPDFELYRKALNLWCKQAFFRLFRRGNGITVGTRLMISTPDVTLPDENMRPGVTLEIRERENDSVILYFYITEVTHVISPQQNRAYTNLVGAWLRPDRDISFTTTTGSTGTPFVLSQADIAAGINNTIYDSPGVLD
jgi:hypothetical protein